VDALPNVERANRALVALWRAGILPEPRIETEALEQAALRGRPSALFGKDEAWRGPFERLVRSLGEEAELNPLGRAMAHGQIVMLLRARMRAARLWREHPEILEHELAPPVVVLGQMRSGTTRMQRLLACDRRLAHTRTYETLTPVPMAGRKLRARSILAALRKLNPQTMRIHPTSAAAPEEEFGWLAFGFGAAQFEAQWRVAAFSRWWEQADKRPLYGELRALLLTNALARGVDLGRPWILKTPAYLEGLPALLATFPEARLILMERKPVEVVASTASLVWNQMRVQSDHADKNWVGREWLRKTRLREERCRADLPASCLRVGYEAMNRDWLGEMRRVYAHLRLELTPAVERRMAAYLAGARGHFGHSYSLEEFGLDPAEVDGALATATGRATASG
jgi:hypothetical protein